ncbi:MAG: D-alanine--D-alanine ligase family protein [Candidatus Paceibacterota bacterium]
MEKKNIAVIFGGKSAEHDVSIITAHIPIIKSLLVSGEFNVWPIYISKSGKWYSNQKMNELDYFKTDNLDEKISKEKEVDISLNNEFKIIWDGIFNKKVNIDIVFPAMHGTYGEDGSLMGVLRMANVPFIGCDLSASAVAMDKVLTKQVLENEKIDVVPYIWFTKEDYKNNKKNILNKINNLGWPLFIKPAHLGSSIGITKAKEETQLENGIEVALHYDDKVLIEKSVENLIEVTLPIMGNEKITFGEIERPLNKSDLFDFNEKYMSKGKTEGVNSQYSEIPAKISDELKEKVLKLGKKTYKTLGCSGIARVDFLINEKEEKVYVNEVNTLPGSLYHHNWSDIGISNLELVKNLVELAEERFSNKKDIKYSFKSDILKKAGGKKLKD